MIEKELKKAIIFWRKNKREIKLGSLSFVLVFFGIIGFWISTFKVPDLSSFETMKTRQSTKIYDRTGKILLYDIHENTKKTVVPFETISRDIKNATVAIEDAQFYEHGGIKISSIIRSVFANILSGSFSQGGSTITQQVIKNSLLTSEKLISRKIKEWVMSMELEKVMTKEQILSIYLNSNPYGGNIYGVEEACLLFFGKSSNEVSLAEAAYIAAIPKAPTYYSPYGQNKDRLDVRQKLVLSRMLENNFITKAEYDTAIKEVVVFSPQEKYGIKAPHFVEFVKQYLADKYGEAAVLTNGYKVTTTLNYDLQAKAESIANKYGLSNETNFTAKNVAAVILDPKTGQILSMVGSRDYFDKNIEGNFNVTLAHRQPGSTFKPFVYATAFQKGYTPDTVVFDLPTEFQSTCTPEGKPINPNAVISSSTACYKPENYDTKYVGPISLRNALAQSRNVPSIKTLYLAGMKDSLQTAKNMGIESLSNDPNQYGLTLVLGGGEVSLLDITNAYGTFANDGIKNKYTAILSVQDSNGNILEQYSGRPQTILEPNIARSISDILSDNVAKIPAYGASSPLFFPGRQVASKTGTTNDSRDAWTIGYTPEVVVGTWAGNNDNTPMVKQVAGMIVAPMWHEIMASALSSTTGETFDKPAAIDPNLKPILRGFWQGNETYIIDKVSGKLATEMTPEETRKEIAVPNVHSILYWINKDDPNGAAPTNPDDDAQFSLWEYQIQEWLKTNPQATIVKPTTYDSIHIEANKPKVTIALPNKDAKYDKDGRITSIFVAATHYPVAKANFYLNDELVGSSETSPFTINFVPSSTNSLVLGENRFKVVVYDNIYNKGEATVLINIQ